MHVVNMIQSRHELGWLIIIYFLLLSDLLCTCDFAFIIHLLRIRWCVLLVKSAKQLEPESSTETLLRNGRAKFQTSLGFPRYQLFWAVSPPVNWYHTHPIIFITQLESCYSLYHATEGRRLIRSRNCSKSVQPMSQAVMINTTVHSQIWSWDLTHHHQARYH